MLINHNTKWSLMILEIFRLSKSNDKIKDLNTLKDVSCADNKLCKNHIQNIFSDKKRLFMLCDSCFWCASSYVHTDRMFTEKCPVCQNKKIELLPISNNECIDLIMT
jgi:hypothetical protein